MVLYGSPVILFLGLKRTTVRPTSVPVPLPLCRRFIPAGGRPGRPWLTLPGTSRAN